MELVRLAHRRGAALQVADVRALVGDYQRPLELPRLLRVDTEVGHQLHGTPHARRDVDEGAVAEDGRVQRGVKVICGGHHRAEVLLHQLRVVLHRLADRAEDHPGFLQHLLVGRGHRDAVEDGVHRHAGHLLLLLYRDAQLVERLDQLGVHVVEALRRVALLHGRRVVVEVLEVDGRNSTLAQFGSLSPILSQRSVMPSAGSPAGTWARSSWPRSCGQSARPTPWERSRTRCPSQSRTCSRSRSPEVLDITFGATNDAPLFLE